jgi:adenine/guanine phosphoribosyltransferase-like PRPP-binding protein
MSRPEVKKIEIRNLPKHGETNLPYIKRTFVHPPGMETPAVLSKYGLYKPEEIKDAIRNSELFSGSQIFLNGLLEGGGVALFGTEQNFDAGINYEDVYKIDYKHGVIDPALGELAIQMRQEAKKTNMSIDGVLAPENSGIKQATMLSSYLDVDCFSVRKNGHKSSFAVAVDSYTQGKIDIISVAQSMLDSMKKNNQKNLILSDDIIDSGAMTEAVALLLQLAQEQGYDIHLVGIVAPIEKTYTGAREKIKEILGDIPIFSALKIEDIGIINNSQAWIKVAGIKKAIPCNLADLRVK